MGTQTSSLRLLFHSTHTNVCIGLCCWLASRCLALRHLSRVALRHVSRVASPRVAFSCVASPCSPPGESETRRRARALHSLSSQRIASHRITLYRTAKPFAAPRFAAPTPSHQTREDFLIPELVLFHVKTAIAKQSRVSLSETKKASSYTPDTAVIKVRPDGLRGESREDTRR